MGGIPQQSCKQVLSDTFNKENQIEGVKYTMKKDWQRIFVARETCKSPELKSIQNGVADFNYFLL